MGPLACYVGENEDAQITRLKSGVLVAIALLAVIHVYAARGLYADGSYFLLEIISRGTFFDFDKPRYFSQIISQLPVVLGLHVGVNRMESLIWLHSLGLFGFPTLFWLLALYKVARNGLFWPFVMVFAVVYLNTSFFSIGEFNLAYSVVAYAMAILLGEDEIGIAMGSILLVLGLILTRSYEGLLFLGPLLYAVSVLRLVRESSQIVERIFLSIAAFLFAVAFAISLWSILFPRDPANLAGATNLASLISNKQWVLSALAAGLYLGMYLLSRYKRLMWLCGVLSSFVIVLLFYPGFYATPFQNYSMRAFGSLVMFCAFSLMVIARFRVIGPDMACQAKEAGGLKAVLFRLLPILMLTALIIPDIHHTLGFRRFIHMFKEATDSQVGIQAAESTKLLIPEAIVYSWAWTYPTLSLLLRRNEHGAIILNPKYYIGWQPFDPAANNKNIARFY